MKILETIGGNVRACVNLYITTYNPLIHILIHLYVHKVTTRDSYASGAINNHSPSYHIAIRIHYKKRGLFKRALSLDVYLVFNRHSDLSP